MPGNRGILRTRRGLQVLLAAACLPVLAGCGASVQANRDLFAMDAICMLQAYGPGARESLDRVAARIVELEEALTSRRPDSGFAAVSQAAGTAPAVLTDDQSRVLEAALSVAALSDGALDPTIGPLSTLWGIGTGREAIPDEAALDAARELVDWRALELVPADPDTGDPATARLPKAGMALDLGAVAKGYVSGEAIRMLRADGIHGALLSLGGNVATFGTKPDGSRFRIGLRDPDGEDTDYLAILDAPGEAWYIVVSGDYERYFVRDGVRYHHLLSPDTGFPARTGLRAVAVVAGDGALADALSTALFVLGLDRGLALWREAGGFEAVFVTDDRRLVATSGLRPSFRFLGKEGYRLIWEEPAP